MPVMFDNVLSLHSLLIQATDEVPSGANLVWKLGVVGSGLKSGGFVSAKSSRDGSA